MRLFKSYVHPVIYKAVYYGVNSCTVNFDEVMNPSIFTQQNMEQLRLFIERMQIGYGKTKVNLTVKDYIGGNRYTFEIYW